MLTPIKRTLAHENCDRQPQVIDQDQIAAIPEPIVILGDPGLGKSVLTKTLGALPSMKYCRAGQFVHLARPETMISAGERIIIDGLDEIASSTPRDAVDSVLRQLSKMGNPSFILSCREADWRGAADSSKIEDDYHAVPVLLRLQPFGYGDAQAFLSNEFPTVNAAFVLEHLASRGLEGIYKNPLTLRLLGEVAQQEEPLPQSRAELLDRACRVMLSEKNRHHFADSHASRSREDLLLAAGAICATQVLCARTGVYTGPYVHTAEDFVNVSDVAKLPFGEAAGDALRTRLFQAEGESQFTHIHRVIAEYLGAKWLVRCFDNEVSERRIFALFRQGEGVPTSLRGLHAWMAHFSDVLAGRCLCADPYAVLRYGDAEKIGLEQARALLDALTKLSEADPYFASEDWGRHPASGLMRAELAEEIRAIITAPDSNTHLSVLLLDAMNGTDLATKLVQVLYTVVCDEDRSFEERSSAADAMRASGTVDDWEAVIHRLLAKEDADSAQLACEILTDIGANTVSIQTGVDAVLARFGITVSPIPRSDSPFIRSISKSLFGELDAVQLGKLLDNFAARARPLIDVADYSANAELADLVRRLALQVLETDSTIEPERIWAWIGWLDRAEGYDNKTRERLTEVFHKEHALRAALLEHVLLTPCEDGAWMALDRLRETNLNLYPTHEDLVGVLEALRARAGDGSIDADTLRHILRLDRYLDGISEIVPNAAIRIADGNPELLAACAEVAEVVELDSRIEQERNHSRMEAKRQEIFQAHRNRHSQRADEVAAGNVQDLAKPADVYLGRYSAFDRSVPPEARVREFLGDKLGEQALMGFIAVLDRSDLPSAADIARIHCEGKHWKAEVPMICGIAEMLRQGRLIETIDPKTLSAVYAAWQQMPESGVEGQIDIGPALEEVLFTDERDVEAHFRTIIEPQLACQRSHIFNLYRLTQEDRWAALAGRLAVKWLGTYPVLPCSVQTELMSCALGNAPHEMLKDLVSWRMHDTSDPETMLLWLSATFAVDFESHRQDLEKTAAEHRDLIWSIRDRLDQKYQEIFSRSSIAQLVFIVEAFGSHWPCVGTPEGVTSGECNPWDASRFIERTLYSIASRPSSEATEALRGLINGPALTYADTAKHALALQRKVRRDSEYAAPSIEDLQAVMANDLPENIDEMRAYLLDHLDALQARMRGSDTYMWETYWKEENIPQPENFCRNRLVEHISGRLPASIRFGPETLMPRQKRADIAATRNAIGLPVEIKGQWHRDVWSAATDQLDTHYTLGWRAQGRGLYIVLWFGNLPKKNLPKHPDDLSRPDTPQELRQMLTDRIPEARRSQIDSFVMDVSRL